MKSKKILVLDDDRIVLESCKRVLEAEGFKVFLVSSAREAVELLKALELLKTGYFDLMIMDVKIPEHDGMYLLEKIKEKWPLDIWPELPVVVMSGYPTPDTISESLDSGRNFSSYLGRNTGTGRSKSQYSWLGEFFCAKSHTRNNRQPDRRWGICRYELLGCISKTF